MSLILSGPPCCGKTYYGFLLAKRLQGICIDTDRLIEEQHALQTGMHLSCREIYQLKGAAAFRDKERQVLQMLVDRPPSVVALGGGALLDQDNIFYLKKMGSIIFLNATIFILWKRLKMKPYWPGFIDSSRPWKSFRQIVEERRAVCKKHATLIVETHKYGDQELVDLLFKWSQENGQ